MAKRCVVVVFDPDNERITSYSCDEGKIKPILSKEFGLELDLADFQSKLDDEFARKFGASTLSLLALYHPELKPLLSFTE